ncbi:MAG: flagellar basal-body rod protein FlgG [Armatimonadetes bacterium]|nr:flagellar basal-body rod protein FlgG [Armatimonadota bacterium]
MMRSLTTAGTGMITQQTNLDVIANNLANVNTTGYKEQKAEFQDLMYQTWRGSGSHGQGTTTNPEALQVGLGARLSSTTSYFTQGPLQSTSNPYDMAIIGDGFFSVERPDGTTAYTRDGSFKVDSNGLVVTNDGYPLQPNITVPTEATTVSISQSGVVSAMIAGSDTPQVLGNITLTTFPNPGGLTRVGQNLYAAGGASGDPQELEPGTGGAGTIQSQHVEGSNVQVVEEMVKMILAQRAYEINSKAIQTSDEMLATLNQLKR